MNPEPYTLQELLWMQKGADKKAWEHTSHLLAMMANTCSGRKSKKTYEAEQFFPKSLREKKDRSASVKAPFEILKKVFVDGHQQDPGRRGSDSYFAGRRTVQEGLVKPPPQRQQNPGYPS